VNLLYCHYRVSVYHVAPRSPPKGHA
jgi:hypothetical protein